jgi:hypothetical protein
MSFLGRFWNGGLENTGLAIKLGGGTLEIQVENRGFIGLEEGGVGLLELPQPHQELLIAEGLEIILIRSLAVLVCP